jgi:hypothetical protein
VRATHKLISVVDCRARERFLQGKRRTSEFEFLARLPSQNYKSSSMFSSVGSKFFGHFLRCKTKVFLVFCRFWAWRDGNWLEGMENVWETWALLLGGLMWS